MAAAWQQALELPEDGRRVWLDDRSWVDHRPGWFAASGALFDLLYATLPWQQRTRVVWEKEHLEPRLTCWELPDPLPTSLQRAGEELSGVYGIDFDQVSANLYRDGRDSVAWHRDRIHRTHTDPLVATISLGGRRPFLVRPYGGGASWRFEVGCGDLLVMGGSCQHRFEHTVPKVSAATPRISVMLRHSSREAPSGRGVALGPRDR